MKSFLYETHAFVLILPPVLRLGHHQGWVVRELMVGTNHVLPMLLRLAKQAVRRFLLARGLEVRPVRPEALRNRPEAEL